MAAERQRRQGAAPRLRRRVPLLVLFLRLLATIVAVQVSGTGHLLLDVAPLVLDVGFEHEDCSEEGSEDSCPPGCPNCHCSHPIGALPVKSVRLEDVQPPALARTWTRPALPDVPAGPDLGCIDRPPKLA